MKGIKNLFILVLVILFGLLTTPPVRSQNPNMNDYCYVPPFVGTSVPANVMLMLSIETPMQGAAHPDITCIGDPRTSYSCSPASCRSVVSERHVSNCYDNTKKYYGYFDPNKCYIYDNGVFRPIGPANNHTCSESWSGNFLNWATTMAVDAMRKAFTGGNRNIDTPGRTQLLGARQTLSPGHSWFPIKRLDNAQNYTPYSGTIYLIRYANGFVVCRDTNNDGLPDCGVGESGSGENLFPTVSNKRCSNDIFRSCNSNSDCDSGATCQTVMGAVASFNLQIEVCNPSKGLEANCNPQTKKPEGVIQKYADKIRFGLISYAMHNNVDYSRDGGVIRANVKWISPKIPYGQKYHDEKGNLVICNNLNGCPNPEREFNEDGTFITNPDKIEGASYSGVINYINKFGYLSGYKTYDPISEMYYEIVRYFKKLGPSTDNYCTGLPTIDDGAPVFCSSSPWSPTNRLGWRDPYIYPCQKSFVVAINDANPWNDKRIPGTSFTAPFGPNSGNCDSTNPPPPGCRDYGTPSNADSSINVSYWTDLVGQYEGITPGYMCIGCVLGGACDWSANSKYVSQLSKAVGTCPYPPKENSYYIAGLAYYARITDLRPDLEGMQNLITYMIDTQEPNPNMLVGRYNMLYLAAKFGGFEDVNNNGRPDLPIEWDKDGDGFPDNYFFASDPTKIEAGLERAFSDILKRASSGATVATLASRYQTSSAVLQPAFYPEYITREGRPIRWLGTFRGYWVDSGQNLREDTFMDKILILLGPFRDKVFTFFFDANKEVKVALLDADPNQNPGVCSYAERKSPIQLRPTLQFDCILAITPKDQRKIYFNDNGNLREFKTSERNKIKPAWTFIDNSLTDSQVNCVIEYLRGEYDYEWNCTSYVMRKRVFDVSQICYNFAQGSNTPWKIGPIVYSTPTVAGNQALNQKYIYVYNDNTYKEYVLSNNYKNRRSVAFVASNIGMLHFFRIGHLKETGDPWQPIKLVNDPSSDQNNLVEREEFAFIPQNALPYMLWYGREDYCSLNKGYIPIVDYRVEVFDASFDKDDDPNGNKTSNSWNTYLLGTMGVGGKQLGSYSSSVFLLKLTKYLNDNTGNTLPELMWEIKLDGGALATSFPARVRQGDRDKNGKWYFVLGSGPKDPNADSYDKFLPDPKLYIINARNGSVHKVSLSSLLPNNVRAAVGDVIEFDIDNDYQDDVIYFGMYGYKNDGSSWGGIYRIALKTQSGYKDPSTISTSDIKKLVELEDFKTGRHIPPVFAAVTATKDESGRLWVYLNTGLYLSPSHRNIPYKNYIIGVIDECWDNVNKYFKSTCNPVKKANLANSKNISGYVNVNGDSCDSSVLNFDFTQTKTENMCVCGDGDSGCSIGQAVKSTNARTDFCVLEKNKKGWFYELDGYIAYSRPAVSFGVLLSMYFKPSDDPCTPVGETFISALRYNTGLPPANPPFIAVGNTEGSKLKYSISIGYGSPPLGEVFRIIRDSAGNLSVVGQTSTGAIFNVRQQIGEQAGRFVLWIEK